MHGHRLGRHGIALGLVLAAGVALAACGSSSGASGTTTTTTTAPGTGASPVLSSANVPGVGRVVVDARGYTVYALANAAGQALPCTTKSGCTAAWPPVIVRTSAGKAVGTDLMPALLTTASVGGSTILSYGGWRLYEFSGDTGPAQSGGQGLQSFGGTWTALTTAGARISVSQSHATSGGW
jgi:predicted lipoprotein with Yx(FWY)xxD motif